MPHAKGSKQEGEEAAAHALFRAQLSQNGLKLLTVNRRQVHQGVI